MNHTYLVRIFTGAIMVGSLFVSSAVSAQSFPSTTGGCLSGSDLRIRSTGEEVSKLQLFLAQQGFLSVAPTGYFGLLTEKAIRDFEASGLCERAPQLTLLSPNTSLVLSTQSSFEVTWSSVNYPVDKNITIVLRPSGLQSWVPSQNGAFAAIVKNDGQETVRPSSLQGGEYFVRILCTDVPHCVFDDSDEPLTVVDVTEQNEGVSISNQTQLASVLLGFQTLLTKLGELIR